MNHAPSTSQRPVRLGIIGAGSRMRGIVRRLLGTAQPGELQITAVYDPDTTLSETLFQDLGCRLEMARSDAEVATHPDVDWVFIGSWNNFHASQAIMALEAGKNVFCEKPLAMTMEECLTIRDAADAARTIFAFGLVLRYSPHYQKMHEILNSGLIGKIISVEFNETLAFNHGGYIFGDWRRYHRYSGGHLLEKCCHDLDLANWLIGSLATRVASFGGKNFFTPENSGRVREIGPNREGRPAYGEWSRFAPHLVDPFLSGADIVDNQVIIMEYANGVRATFHTNCNAAIPERRFYILGSHGSLRADLLTGRIEACRIGWDTKIENMDAGATDNHGGGDGKMAIGLYNTLIYQQPPEASVFEGLCSAVTALAAEEARQSGTVVDVTPYWNRAGIETSGGRLTATA